MAEVLAVLHTLADGVLTATVLGFSIWVIAMAWRSSIEQDWDHLTELLTVTETRPSTEQRT